MGVLVNYSINDLTADEVLLIGEAIDLLPHGRVQRLVAKIQPQISQQEAAENERLKDEHEAKVEAWRDAERQKIKDDMAKQPPSKKGK